ncbi:MAG: CpsD/CapB family tyrosine-protein kinase [Chloroflexota bacterium]
MADVNSLAAVVDPRSAQAEAYRALRASVEFAGVERPLRRLLLTSPSPREDSATVAANLAATFAQGGSRVVLVDCDLRQPRLHALFGVANERGLGNLKPAALEQTVALLPSGLANLELLPAGPAPANPLDFLVSVGVQSAFDRLAENHDLLIFAAPPVLAVADAAVLSRFADGVLLVFQIDRTKRDQAGKARDLLAKAKANVLGAVLTNAKVEPSLRQYYG